MRILVVDDDAVSRLLLATAVETLGHRAVPVADGDEAWACYLEEPPDVVITDRVMSGLDGLELCRRIRRHHESTYTYLILATSLGSQQDVIDGMEAGADDYLVKPVDPFELRVRLLAAERITALHEQLVESRAALEALNADLARMASTDGLTGIGNRRRFDEDLASLHARSRRQDEPYALALLDIDRFKAYNDACGHLAGDRALRTIAQHVASVCRQGDEVYRYGGEELAVLLHTEQLPGAATAAERVRESVEGLGLPHPEGVTDVLTVSVGVADSASVDPADEPLRVVAAADAALYEAKEAGRNRVVPPPGATVPR